MAQTLNSPDRNVLKWTRVRINNEEIKALPSTAIQLVPSLGQGKMLLGVTAVLSLRGVNHTADYTNIDAEARLRIGLASEDGIIGLELFNPLSEENSEQVTSLLSFNGDSGGNAILTPRVSLNILEDVEDVYSLSGIELASLEDRGLYLDLDNSAGGELTGGHVDHTLTVSIFYVEVPI